jgi:hypothetical protein
MSYDIGNLGLRSGEKKKRTPLYIGIGVVVIVIVVVAALFLTHVI